MDRTPKGVPPPAGTSLGSATRDGEGDAERRDVDAVDGAQPESGDRHPGDGRSDDEGQLLDHRLQRDGVREVLGGHEHGEGGPPGGPVEALEGGAGGGANEQRPHPGVSEGGVDHETGAARRERHLCEHQHRLAVDGVGDRAAPHRSDDEGQDLGGADQAHDEGRVGQLVGLVRDGYQRELAARARDGLTEPELAEVAVPAQGGDVCQDPCHLEHGTAESTGRRAAARGGSPVRATMGP